MENNLLKLEDEKSFAHDLNFFKLFWIFYIGCFAGVVVETIWCIATNGYLQSRTALVLEPLNPVYGFGAVLISICFVRQKKLSPLWIFIGCSVLGAAFEFICSLFQEMAFGTVSWSYSADSLGLFERTSLLYAGFWGILGIVWVSLIYPFLSDIIEKIPNKIGVMVSYILIAFVCFDMVFSSLAVYRQSERRDNIPATNNIQVFFDTYYTDELLKKIYPNMTPTNGG